jgi:hypothetical protein
MLRANSSFANAASVADFNGRWLDWPEEKRARFMRHAGRQLAQWGYADTPQG